jgi:hypothetical protein
VGTVIISGDSQITGNKATSCCGGVYNYYGTVTMNYGSITGNKANSHGGGIWSNADMNLKGGSIVWNTPDDLYDDRYAP